MLDHLLGICACLGIIIFIDIRNFKTAPFPPYYAVTMQFILARICKRKLLKMGKMKRYERIYKDIEGKLLNNDRHGIQEVGGSIPLSSTFNSSYISNPFACQSYA